MAQMAREHETPTGEEHNTKSQQIHSGNKETPISQIIRCWSKIGVRAFSARTKVQGRLTKLARGVIIRQQFC